MVTLQRVKQFLIVALLSILLSYFSIFRFDFPATVWEMHSLLNTSVPHNYTDLVRIYEDEDGYEVNIERGYDRSAKIHLIELIGGPRVIFEYYRAHVFMKECQEEENNECSEAKAEEVWREMSDSEKKGRTYDALIHYLTGDYELEDDEV